MQTYAAIGYSSSVGHVFHRLRWHMRPWPLAAAAVLLCTAGCATVGQTPVVTKPAPPVAEKILVIDLARMQWQAFDEHHQLLKEGRAVGGRAWCPDTKAPCRTPVGLFRVQRTGGAGCVSHTFPMPHGGAPMPYCMFFRGGYAIHGWRSTLPQRHASHGCVRVTVEDARWLNQHFLDRPNPQSGHAGTKIQILPYAQ